MSNTKKINFRTVEIYAATIEVTKGSIASLVLTQYCDFLESSLSCGTFGLLSVGTTNSNRHGINNARDHDPIVICRNRNRNWILFLFLFIHRWLKIMRFPRMSRKAIRSTWISLIHSSHSHDGLIFPTMLHLPQFISRLAISHLCVEETVYLMFLFYAARVSCGGVAW